MVVPFECTGIRLSPVACERLQVNLYSRSVGNAGAIPDWSAKGVGLPGGFSLEELGCPRRGRMELGLEEFTKIEATPIG